MTTLRAASQLLRPRLLLEQWLGTLAFALAGCLWLQVPDSHTWQFLLSMLIALAWMLGILWFYASTFSRLDSPAGASTWRRAFVFALAMAVMFVAVEVISAGRARESLYAGYWNSRLPSGPRMALTYAHFMIWQETFWDCATWLLTALVLPIAFTGAVRRRVRSIFRNFLYWLTVAIVYVIANFVTVRLLEWQPGTSAHAQVISLLLRLFAAYTFDAVLWCGLLCVMAAAVRARAEQAAQPI